MMEIPPIASGASGPTPRDKKGFATASLVLGIINLCAWMLPICGGPLAIVGIILGIVGIRSSQKPLAIVGIVLSALGLTTTIVIGIVGGGAFGLSNPTWIQQIFPSK